MAKQQTKNRTNKAREFRVTGVGDLLFEETKNVVSHIGGSMSDYLKVKIKEVIDKEPAHYKKPMED